MLDFYDYTHFLPFGGGGGGGGGVGRGAVYKT